LKTIISIASIILLVSSGCKKDNPTTTPKKSVPTITGNWATGGPNLSGGIIETIGIEKNKIFACSGGGGIYLSTNNGLSWLQVNNGLPSNNHNQNNYNEIAVNDTDIFMSYLSSSAAMYFSNNNGSNWSAIDNGLPAAQIMAITVKGNDVFAGTSNGMYKSSNNGGFWSAIDTGLPAKTVIYAMAVTDSAIYVASLNNIYISNNSGTSWSVLGQPLPGIYQNCMTASGDSIVVGTYYGLYTTTNLGATWTAVGSSIFGNSPSSGGPQIISLATSGSDIIVSLLQEVYFSNDYGNTWYLVAGLPANMSVFSIVINNGTIYACGAIDSSTNPESGPIWTGEVYTCPLNSL